MMIDKRKAIVLGVVALIGAAVFLRFSRSGNNNLAEGRAVNPEFSDVAVMVSTTGVIEPRNRLEMKPSINGRIESILVKEGDRIKAGEILAWMSSTERAALVDAARSGSQEELEYWEEVYKKTPLISPINGEVIVRSVEPGQTVTSADPVLVLSDYLVVKAQFDETDVGRIAINREAVVSLDAYPEIKVNGKVEHIAYESELVNNVTIYNVDISLEQTPEILRSGMSVSVEVVETKKINVLTIPSAAIRRKGDQSFVLLKESWGKTIEREVQTGLDNDKLVEIVSGLSETDKVMVPESAPISFEKKSGANPFMPQRKKR